MTFLFTARGTYDRNYDEDGIIWPFSVCPYSALLLPMSVEEKGIKEMAEKLYQSLQKNRIDVIMDDRKVSPGVKFKDGDLLGIPLRIVVGKELKNGKVELKLRREKKTELVKVEDVPGRVKAILAAIEAPEDKPWETLRVKLP